MEYLDVQTPDRTWRVPLEDERITIGRSDANTIAFSDDASTSRVHAVIERVAAGWTIRDMGSTNGTLVSGKRVWGEQTLHPGDEITIGRARLLFGRIATGVEDDSTVTGARAPDVTRRERDVLNALCGPALSGDI